MSDLDGLPADDASVRALDRAHVFHSWSAQQLIDPLPIASALGSYFTDYAGTRYLDFSSQLVNVPTSAHSAPARIDGGDPASKPASFCTVAPAASPTTQRGEAARLITELAPDGFNKVFFTNAGAEAVENADPDGSASHRQDQDPRRPTAATTVGPLTAVER